MSQPEPPIFPFIRQVYQIKEGEEARGTQVATNAFGPRAQIEPWGTKKEAHTYTDRRNTDRLSFCQEIVSAKVARSIQTTIGRITGLRTCGHLTKAHAPEWSQMSADGHQHTGKEKGTKRSLTHSPGNGHREL